MRWLRMVVALGMGALAAGLLAPVAIGGGWAATSLDPVAGPLEPGQPTEIGYTVLQHGQTPVDVPDTAIVVRSESGTTVFPGRRSGPTGHYVATVTVPERGVVEWSLRQGWFGEQPLGSLRVGGAAAPPAQAAVTDAGGSTADLIGMILLGAAALCGGLLVAQIVAARRMAGAAGAGSP
jgi:hypothetical protein